MTWVIDSDFRGIDGVMLPYDQRRYACPHCRHDGSGCDTGATVAAEFLLQPHDLYPMTLTAFDYWVKMLRAQFPDHPHLARLGRRLCRVCLKKSSAMREAHALAKPGR